MSSFRFKFESLLQYRQRRRDLCVQTLAQALAQDQELATTQQSVEQTMQRKYTNFGRLAGEVHSKSTQPGLGNPISDS